MVSTSKILTVSYGTFSCTLEGFDDSFTTMKSIAEYFRDLAADDRYFGAEPPQPDAELLAAIASRETARQVQAHQQGSEIVLRAEDSAAALIDGDDASAEALEEPKKKKKKKNKAKGSNKPKGKAKAAARRAAKAAAAVDAAAIVDIPAEDAEVVLDQEPVGEAAAHLTEAESGAEATDQDDVLSNVLAASDTGSAEISDLDVDTVKEATAFTEVPHPDADSVAAKLQRIRAVVSDEQSGSDFSEDQHATDLAEPFLNDDIDLSDSFEEETDDLAALDGIDLNTTEIDADAVDALETDDNSDTVDEGVETDQDQTTDNLAERDASFEDDGEIDLAAVSAAVLSDDEDELSDDQQPDEDIEIDDLSDTADDADDLSSIMSALSDDTDVEDDAERPVQPRVIKVKRADFEKAIEDGAFEEIEDDVEIATNLADLDGLDEIEGLTSTVEATSDLSDDDEAELLADLADVVGRDADPQDEFVADVEDQLDEVVQDVDVEDTVRPRRNRRALLEEQTNDDEAAVSRLMEKTDEQMDAPESSRRRNAIAHLKAAVAAKEAARKMGEDDEDQDPQNAFREDLSRVVRPSRPKSSGTARASRVPPLKLVAEQRVDAPSPKADGPVTPRRISVRKVAEVEDETTSVPEVANTQVAAANFAEFAQDMGAHDLADLLEAAAAYTSFVEGKDEFSRPQVMNIVKGLQDEDFNREDGLRSFGTLLRQGKIQKLGAGRFQVAEDSRFRPEDRAAS